MMFYKSSGADALRRQFGDKKQLLQIAGAKLDLSTKKQIAQDCMKALEIKSEAEVLELKQELLTKANTVASDGT